VYSTIRADLAVDRRRIIDVWARNRPHFSERRFEWIYGNEANGASAVWFLRAGDETVGASALLVRKVGAGSLARRLGQAIDLVVDPAHRSLGPALALQRAVTGSCGELGLEAVYAFPNARADALLLRSGYSILGPLDRWTKPLRSSYKIDSIVRVPALARAAAAVVDVALRIAPANWAHRSAPGLVGEEVSAFDRSFDDLWSGSRFAAGSIRGERSAAFLEWRFTRCPQRDYRIFRVRDPRGSLAGYVVWHVANDVANVADLFVRDEGAFQAVVGLFARHARRAGLSAVTFVYLGPESIGRHLAAFGFFHRPDEAKVTVFRPDASSRGPDDPFVRRDDWYLTDVDRDV